MSGSQLSLALDPKSVAIIGASENPNKIGGRPLNYLARFGYRGKIFPINPKRSEVQGFRAFPSMAALPEPADVAIVVVAGDAAIDAAAECAEAGVKLAIVMASGFGETDPVEGKEVLQEMLKLYDFSDLEAGQQLAAVTRGVIEGILSVSSRRVVGRTGSEVASGFCRGV